ncbi:MAG: hypothetical protein ABSB86_07800 [Bryobacteraceae bacterium]
MRDLLLIALPYAPAAALTIILLCLHGVVGRRLRKLSKQVAQCEASMTARGSEFSEFSDGLAELKRSMAEWKADAEPRVADHAIRVASLNNSLRGKVLKMHRLGQPADRIAEALSVPKGEVDLLVKVHRIVMRPYETAPAAAPPK